MTDDRIFVPHAITRAKERCGLDLKITDLKEICRMVANNEAKAEKVQSNGTIWKLRYLGKSVRVVIAHHSDRILTFLPPKHQRYVKKKKRVKTYINGRPTYWEVDR